MHHIIYMSSVTETLTDEQLRQLLAQARAKNAALQVTGLLLVGNGNIVQVMEGEQAVVQALYERIAADPRHAGIVKLADKPIVDRSFGDWAMACHPLTDEAQAELEGFVNLTQLDLDRYDLGTADTLLLQLLRSFVVAPVLR